MNEEHIKSEDQKEHEIIISDVSDIIDDRMMENTIEIEGRLITWEKDKFKNYDYDFDEKF
jgi:hypothetical protein